MLRDNPYPTCEICGRPLPDQTGKRGRPRVFDTDECRQLASALNVMERKVQAVSPRLRPRMRLELRNRLMAIMNRETDKPRKEKTYYLARLRNKGRGIWDVYPVDAHGKAKGSPKGVAPADRQAERWMRVEALNMKDAKKLWTKGEGQWVTANGRRVNPSP